MSNLEQRELLSNCSGEYSIYFIGELSIFYGDCSSILSNYDIIKGRLYFMEAILSSAIFEFSIPVWQLY